MNPLVSTEIHFQSLEEKLASVKCLKVCGDAVVLWLTVKAVQMALRNVTKAVSVRMCDFLPAMI